MSQIPLISVIIPAYNAETTIGYTLSSVLGQTLQDFEIIVIDDASVDRTVDVVGYFGDGRIYVVKNEATLGPGSSRNVGIRMAQGHYVTFIDADDAVSPDYLETLVSASMSCGDEVILATDIWVCKSDPQGGMRPVFRVFEKRGLVLKSNVAIVSIADLINHLIDIKPFVSLKMLRNNSIQFLEGSVGEEWLPLLIDLSRCGAKFGLINRPLYYYRSHSGNISRSYRCGMAEWRVVQRMLSEREIDPVTRTALIRYVRFLEGRLPWLALRERRIREFLKLVLQHPSSLFFPVRKLVGDRIRFSRGINKICG